MVISKKCCNFIVLNYKVLQTIIAMITKNKVTELFCRGKLNCVIVLFFLLASKISFHIEFIFRYLSESKIMVYLID